MFTVVNRFDETKRSRGQRTSDDGLAKRVRYAPSDNRFKVFPFGLITSSNSLANRRRRIIVSIVRRRKVSAEIRAITQHATQTIFRPTETRSTTRSMFVVYFPVFLVFHLGPSPFPF